MDARAVVDVEDLLKLVLVLVVVWLALEVLDTIFDLLFGGLVAILRPLIGLLVVALIVLWLLDRL
jgi:hypothetical protein